MILLLFQTILVCSNVFFFSRDIEKILHMPIKPIELLMAKLNTLLCMLYVSEGILGLVPLTLYGLLTHAPFPFYLGEIIVLITLPVFIAIIISIVMLMVMRLGKLVKNKEIFQFTVHGMTCWHSFTRMRTCTCSHNTHTHTHTHTHYFAIEK